jgi:hypothetical protein
MGNVDVDRWGLAQKAGGDWTPEVALAVHSLQRRFERLYKRILMIDS